MKILSNTLVWNQVNKTISGSVVGAILPGKDELRVTLPLPNFQVTTVGGMAVTQFNGQQSPGIVLPIGGYSWALVKPSPYDIDGSGLVDGGDLGLLPVDGDMGGLLAAWGAGDAMIGSMGFSFGGSGGADWSLGVIAFPHIPNPTYLPVDAALKIAMATQTEDVSATIKVSFFLQVNQ